MRELHLDNHDDRSDPPLSGMALYWGTDGHYRVEAGEFVSGRCLSELVEIRNSSLVIIVRRDMDGGMFASRMMEVADALVLGQLPLPTETPIDSKWYKPELRERPS